MIYSLENEFGEIEEGNENVTKTIFEYYKKLLTKEPENENFQDILLEKVDLRLSEGETEYLDKLITKDELRKFKNNKKEIEHQAPMVWQMNFTYSFGMKLGNSFIKPWLRYIGLESYQTHKKSFDKTDF